MSRGILIGDRKQIDYVYPQSVRDALLRDVLADETVFTKDEILNAPERFQDTEYLFSTWGMPVFTEEEIESCFPKLRAVFYAAGTVQSFARPFLARGVQVVEHDLTRFLHERPDCTAVLDVTTEEPLPDANPLRACENCFITTHIAGSAGQEVWRMAEYMLEEYRRFEAGEATRFGVTEKMLETMA